MKMEEISEYQQWAQQHYGMAQYKEAVHKRKENKIDAFSLSLAQCKFFNHKAGNKFRANWKKDKM